MTATILAWVNAALGFLLVVFAMRYIRRSTGVACWMKMFTVLIGLYWCALYVFVALTPPGLLMDSVAFGQIFVRPAFTVTLAVMAGGAIYRWRSYD
jgi:hypothetical protein